MVRIASALILLQGFALAAEAQTVTPLPPMPKIAVSAAAALPAANGAGLPLESNDRAEVLHSIAQMRTEMSALVALRRKDAVSVRAQTFADHWQSLADDYSFQQNDWVQDVVADMRFEQERVLSDLPDLPLTPTGPSLFDDPIFTVPDPIPLDGFFGS